MSAYDVVVVGARVAGAPTAMLFARRGYRVLLVDKVQVPADKLSTLYIQQPGVARLARWGVLDAVRDSGCPPLDHVVYEMGGVRVEGCSQGVDGFRAAFAPRRYILDEILVRAAEQAGVEFRDRQELVGLVTQDDRVTGVRLRGPDGTQTQEQATLVVGADGMRSTVAKLVNAPMLVEHPRLTCAYYTLWTGVEADFEMFEGETGWVSAVPTNGDAVLVAAYYPQDRFTEVRHDAQASYEDNIRTNAPSLWERLTAAEQVERLYGTGDQQNFFRKASGDGWALVGDAGHHKDSLTARGITDAMMQAELLVDSVADGLPDPAARARGLAAFGEERDARLTENFRATLMVASAGARDKRAALLRTVASDPEWTQRYFDSVAGVLPVSGLYTPELLAAMAAQATPEVPVPTAPAVR